jgi:hypothetical protein
MPNVVLRIQLQLAVKVVGNCRREQLLQVHASLAQQLANVLNDFGRMRCRARLLQNVQEDCEHCSSKRSPPNPIP